MSDLTLLSEFRDKLPDGIKNEMTIDTAHKVLYHISPNPNITVFSPRPIQRTMKGEDEEVKRVCTGITLLDCLRGYAVCLQDYMKKKAHCAGDDNWLGGYVIYAIPTEGSIRPSPVLAPISQWSEERWLVNYREEDQQYPAKLIGRFFINELKVSDNEGDRTIESYLLLDLKSGPFRVSPLISLSPGYYRLNIPSLERYNDRPLDATAVGVIELTEEEYKEGKRSRAALLSYDNLQVNCIRW